MKQAIVILNQEIENREVLIQGAYQNIEQEKQRINRMLLEMETMKVIRRKMESLGEQTNGQ